MNRSWIFGCIFFLGIWRTGYSQGAFQPLLNQLDSAEAMSEWVDSVYQKMTLKQRIGQLFMVAAYSNKDESHYKQIEKLVREHHIGGLIFFQGGPLRQLHLTERYQTAAQTPLFIGIDGEWGLSMRLDSVIRFPRQMLIGAIEEDAAAYEYGKIIAAQCNALGIHINFAPVVDINSNPKNPVIHDRSFGEDKFKVMSKGKAYMRGLQDHGVIACAKHFPGHGDTQSDSHHSLPVIYKSRNELFDTELFPFVNLMDGGVKSVMVAHLHIPAFDSTKNRAVSLSPPLIQDYLINQLQFKGLIFSDALNMKGVSGFYAPGLVDYLAFAAGTDVLLFPENVPLAIQMIHDSVLSGALSEARLSYSVRKILAYKYEAGLHQRKPLNPEAAKAILNDPYADFLKQQWYEKGITLCKNDQQAVPISDVSDGQTLILSFGESRLSAFEEMLMRFTQGPVAHASFLMLKDSSQAWVDRLSNHKRIIIGFKPSGKSVQRNFGITESMIRFIRKLSERTQVVLCVFASPYAAASFADLPTLLVAYEDDEAAQKAAAQIIMGSIPAMGVLPVGIHPQLVACSGIKTNTLNRLHYSSPYALQIHPAVFQGAEKIIEQALRDQVFPGCQLLVAKNNKVIYDRAFGYHTYEQTRPVQTTDVYDLASITKVAATTLLMMKMEENQEILLNRPIGDYLPIPEPFPLSHVPIRKILTHHAGLVSWLPFYAEINSDSLKKVYFKNQSDSIYALQVADSLFVRRDIESWIFQKIYQSPLNTKGEYKYSDLGFYLFKGLIERHHGKSMEILLEDEWYRSLGIRYLVYNPLAHFSKTQIVPTEREKAFRKQLIHGFVHDPGAAMLGGVGGHAGLFGNIYGLAPLMQMLLNEGEYGGISYLNPRTIQNFSRKQQTTSRRGLGFDKPELDITKSSPIGRLASPLSYGHTGFTGTIAWVDPEHQLIFIFLSNRIHPDASNDALIKQNIRTKIYDSICEGLLAPSLGTVKN